MKYTSRFRDFNTPFLIIYRSGRQTKKQTNKNSNRSIDQLDNTINQFDLIDMYRIFYSKTKEYTFFSKCTKKIS